MLLRRQLLQNQLTLNLTIMKNNKFENGEMLYLSKSKIIAIIILILPKKI